MGPTWEEGTESWCHRAVGHEFGKMQSSQMGGGAGWQCECIWCPTTIHLNRVKTVSLCVCYCNGVCVLPQCYMCVTTGCVCHRNDVWVLPQRGVCVTAMICVCYYNVICVTTVLRVHYHSVVCYSVVSYHNGVCVTTLTCVITTVCVCHHSYVSVIATLCVTAMICVLPQWYVCYYSVMCVLPQCVCYCNGKPGVGGGGVRCDLAQF